jgi:hypothetical protein
MYLDNLTLASLVVFVAGLSAFIYACLIRSCLSDDDSNSR